MNIIILPELDITYDTWFSIMHDNNMGENIPTCLCRISATARADLVSTNNV
jgi:hypothetical protein